MSSYIGRHAELYDLFYSDKPYAEETEFVHQCINRYGLTNTHRLLELACGTGVHAFALEKLGYKIVATDYSEDMLLCARKKAAQISSSIDFRCQDMRSVKLSDEPFDAVICLFDSIGYVQTNEALEQVLQTVRNLLQPEGVFIFEFWHAGAMLRYYEPVRIRRWATTDGEILRISETKLEYSRQLANVNYSVYEHRNDGTYVGFQETQVNRYFLLQEIAAFLSSTGFRLLKSFSGFTENENITDQTWHVVVVAKKTKEFSA